MTIRTAGKCGFQNARIARAHMALFLCAAIVQAVDDVLTDDITDDYESSISTVHDHVHGHHEEAAAIWFWFFLVLGVAVLLILCLGVGWYGGSRRREYYIRHPDGTVLGYVDTTTSTTKASAQPKKSRAALAF